MFETFKTFEPMLQIYWGLAILSSIVFCIQAIGTFMGFGDLDTDIPDDAPELDSAFDADGFHLVSVKTIICFLLGFGWTGALLWDTFPNRAILAVVAFLVGLVFMSLIAFLLFQVMKLDRDNTFHVQHTVGKTAEVYLRIAPARKESGKVQVSVNGSVHELEALTDGSEEIKTGDQVKIVGVIADSTVLVEKL